MKANCTVYVKQPHGIEVRDADKLVVAASDFEADVRFVVGQKQVSAKSLFAVITLDWRRGSEINIKADGKDAIVAVDTLAKIINSI